MDEILFTGLVGQDRALEILSKFFNSKRIPHALLFSGPEGIGRHLAAQNFLKLLNNNLPNEKKSKIFSQIDNFEEPAVKFVMPLPRGKGETNSDTPTSKLSPGQIEEIVSEIKKKSQDSYHKINVTDANAVKINSIRDIRKFISLYGGDEEYKGIIISDAHLMTVEAQNALLKNLEEPPEKVIFFLITHQIERLLETIISRSWKVDFFPLSDELVEKILIKKYDIEPGEARLLSTLAYGSVTNALRLKEYNLVESMESVITVLRYSLGRKYATAIKEYNKSISNNSSDAFIFILKLILHWFGDAEMQRKLGSVQFFIKHKETLEKFNHRFSKVDISDVLDKLNRYILYRDQNISLNVLMLNVIFDIAKITI